MPLKIFHWSLSVSITTGFPIPSADEFEDDVCRFLWLESAVNAKKMSKEKARGLTQSILWDTNHEVEPFDFYLIFDI